MTKVSIKNLSLLSVVLMAASAVTAAVLPDKSEGKRAHNGTLRAGSATVGATGNVQSCIALAGKVTCTASETITTQAAADSFVVINGFNYQTVNNTSIGANANSELAIVLP